MKEKENERKEEFQGCKCKAYGMSGVRKQTNSIHDTIQRSIIMRMDDGKVNHDPIIQGNSIEFKGRALIC